jgi:hypothetical protein
VLEEVLGLAVDVELAALGVLGEVESRDLGNVLILALTLLFLQLEGDTTNGTTLNTLHQVGGVTGNLSNPHVSLSRSTLIYKSAMNSEGNKLLQFMSYLVAEALGGDDGNLIADALVRLEVEGELGVVPLNDDLGGLLHGLGTNATHLDGIVVWCCRRLRSAGRWVMQSWPTSNLMSSEIWWFAADLVGEIC